MSKKAEALKDEGTRRQVLLAGGIAGLVSRFCIAPLDVLKIRLQLQSRPSNRTGSTSPTRLHTIDTFRTILRNEGLLAFWKGNIPAELLYVTYGALQFSIYRSTTQLWHSLPAPYRLPDAAESFVSGAVAGGTATTATYPLDLLRTRFAAQGKERVYRSLRVSVRDITANEGPKGFFLGLSAAITQIVPYMGLFFASYESLKPVLHNLSSMTDISDVNGSSTDGSTSLLKGSSDALAGTISSVIAKTAVFPLDTVRKRLQVQGPTRSRYAYGEIPEYRGVGRTVQSVLRKEGMRGLYRGLTVSLVKAAPASAVTMWTYERALGILRTHEVGC